MYVFNVRKTVRTFLLLASRCLHWTQTHTTIQRHTSKGCPACKHFGIFCSTVVLLKCVSFSFALHAWGFVIPAIKFGTSGEDNISWSYRSDKCWTTQPGRVLLLACRSGSKGWGRFLFSSPTPAGPAVSSLLATFPPPSLPLSLPVLVSCIGLQVGRFMKEDFPLYHRLCLCVHACVCVCVCVLEWDVSGA